mmetsp:Transcript_5236/g.13029  ORF Transcript_5236/g.13029 Transcript_5236/m.13029 type:complete len:386 (+) Transcript_5236:735-1892(+)
MVLLQGLKIRKEEDTRNADEERGSRLQPPQFLPLLGRRLRGDQREQTQEAERAVQRLGVLDVRHDVPNRLVDVLRLGNVEADDVLRLAEHDDERRPRREATNDGVRQERDEEPEAKQPASELDERDQERAKEDELGVLIGAHLILPQAAGVVVEKVRALGLRQQAVDARLHEQRHNRHWPDRQLPRLAEEHVDYWREERRVQPVVVLQASNVGVGHALGNGDHTYSDARDDVGGQNLFPAAPTEQLREPYENRHVRRHRFQTRPRASLRLFLWLCLLVALCTSDHTVRHVHGVLLLFLVPNNLLRLGSLLLACGRNLHRRGAGKLAYTGVGGVDVVRHPAERKRRKTVRAAPLGFGNAEAGRVGQGCKKAVATRRGCAEPKGARS